MRKMAIRAKFSDIGMYGNSLCHVVRDIAQEGCRFMLCNEATTGRYVLQRKRIWPLRQIGSVNMQISSTSRFMAGCS
jgi:hypothetical protein